MWPAGARSSNYRKTRACCETWCTSRNCASRMPASRVRNRDRPGAAPCRRNTESHMNNTLPSWVTEAAHLPVAFAQVREDPLLDAWVVEKLGPEARLIMIASGGCTLAFLAARSRVARIDV